MFPNGALVYLTIGGDPTVHEGVVVSSKMVAGPDGGVWLYDVRIPPDKWGQNVPGSQMWPRDEPGGGVPDVTLAAWLEVKEAVERGLEGRFSDRDGQMVYITDRGDEWVMPMFGVGGMTQAVQRVVGGAGQIMRYGQQAGRASGAGGVASWLRSKAGWLWRIIGTGWLGTELWENVDTILDVPASYSPLDPAKVPDATWFFTEGGMDGDNGGMPPALFDKAGVYILKEWQLKSENKDGNVLITRMVRLSDGRHGAQRQDGSWKLWRPKRPIMVYTKGVLNLHDLERLHDVIVRQAKKLKKVVKNLT